MKGTLVLVGVAWTLCAGAAVGVNAQAQPGHAASKLYDQSLGVNCEHCHSADDLADASKPNFDFARRMQRMVLALNEGPLKGVGSVTCWSCHRGLRIPARLPRPAWESIATAHAGDFVGGRDGLGLAMSVYTASLGVDCSHCHVAGNWTSASKPPHQMVQVMAPIFDLIPIYFDKGIRMPNTQCYMCHQGHVRVERAVP